MFLTSMDTTTVHDSFFHDIIRTFNFVYIFFMKVFLEFWCAV